MVNAPAMWWGTGPGTERVMQHAVAPEDVALAEERGWTESLCGQRLPVGVELLSESASELRCIPCFIGATADLSDIPAPTATSGITLPPLTGFGGGDGEHDRW